MKCVLWLPPELHPLEEVDEQFVFGLSADLGAWICSEWILKGSWLQVSCEGFGHLC